MGVTSLLSAHRTFSVSVLGQATRPCNRFVTLYYIRNKDFGIVNPYFPNIKWPSKRKTELKD